MIRGQDLLFYNFFSQEKRKEKKKEGKKGGKEDEQRWEEKRKRGAEARGRKIFITVCRVGFFAAQKTAKKIFSSAPTLVHIRNNWDAANIDKFRRPWLAGYQGGQALARADYGLSSRNGGVLCRLVGCYFTGIFHSTTCSGSCGY